MMPIYDGGDNHFLYSRTTCHYCASWHTQYRVSTTKSKLLLTTVYLAGAQTSNMAAPKLTCSHTHTHTHTALV